MAAAAVAAVVGTTTSRSEGALRLATSLGAALLLIASAACRSSDPPAPAAASLPEAVRPASLVAELSLGNPKETWQRLRLLGGDLAQALPSSLPVLMATSLSLPPSAAGSLDETVPMVAVLLSRPDHAEPDAVLGMHVVSGAELVASLTLGDGAKFRRVELAPRVVRLLPAPGAAELDGALGVSGNYLLLGTRVEAMTDAGRFVAESVSKRARSAPGITLRASQSVLGGALAQHLRAAWQAQHAALSARARAEREAKGRPPDFADPEVLLSGADNMIESWLSVLESSRELSLGLTPGPDRLRAELLLAPGTEGAAPLLFRELVVGSNAPLLELPVAARAGLLLQGDAQATTSSLGASIAKLFGERLSPEHAARVSKAFDNLARSRRGASVFGLLPAPVPALVVSCELSGDGQFADAFAEVLSLIELPAVSGWLTRTVGKPSLELTRAAGGTRNARIRFRRTAGPPSPSLPKSLNVSFRARDGRGSIVVSAEELVDLDALSGQPRLGSLNWFSDSQQGLSNSTALSLYADARLLAPGGPDEAPILLSFGKKDEQTALGLDVSAPALAALARRFALDRSP
jgi:hypothetical protein